MPERCITSQIDAVSLLPGQHSAHLRPSMGYGSISEGDHIFPTLYWPVFQKISIRYMGVLSDT